MRPVPPPAQTSPYSPADNKYFLVCSGKQEVCGPQLRGASSWAGPSLAPHAGRGRVVHHVVVIGHGINPFALYASKEKEQSQGKKDGVSHERYSDVRS